MTIFDVFRFGLWPVAKPARRASQSHARVLGSHFELLESRCLLSVAPPTISLTPAEHVQIANYFASALVLSPSAALSGGAPAVISGGTESANLPPLGQYSIAPLAGQQLQALPAVNEAGFGLLLNGMVDIRNFKFSDALAVPSAAFGGTYDHEAREVREMLSSLQYVPLIVRAPDALPPALPVLSSAPAAASDPPSLPASAPLSPSVAPTLLNSAPPLPGSTETSSRSEPASPQRSPSQPDSAPAATLSAPPLKDADLIGGDALPRSSEGGMVAILRQPVGQLSTVHKPSIAAIDELLETPAKVEGLQGRFQAFEVSVTRETPMPAATLPRAAQNNVLFESSTAKALPAIDLGFHIPSDRLDLAESTAITFRSPVEAPAAGLVTTPIPIEDSLLTPGVLSVEAIDAVIGDLSSEAMHDALSSNFRLELATAALLAALIGRAVWPTRPPQAEGHEKRQRG